MAEKIVGLSQVSSEQTLNDRQSLQELPAMQSQQDNQMAQKRLDKNIFYQYVNGAASNTDLQNGHGGSSNPFAKLQHSQSELSSGLMAAVDINHNNGFSSAVNGQQLLHHGVTQHGQIQAQQLQQPGAATTSIFNRVVLSQQNHHSRENAFSASGQKMVHFKDGNGAHLQTSLEDEQRQNQVRSALLKDFNPRKNVTANNSGAVILSDVGYKTATAFNSQDRRYSKKRFLVADEAEESEKGNYLTAGNADHVRNHISKSALTTKTGAVQPHALDPETNDLPYSSKANNGATQNRTSLLLYGSVPAGQTNQQQHFVYGGEEGKQRNEPVGVAERNGPSLGTLGQYRTAPHSSHGNRNDAAVSKFGSNGSTQAHQSRGGWGAGGTLRRTQEYNHEERKHSDSRQSDRNNHEKPMIEIEGSDAQISLVSPVQIQKNRIKPSVGMLSELHEQKSNGYSLQVTGQKSQNAVSFGSQAQAATASAYLFQQQKQSSQQQHHKQLMASDDLDNLLTQESGSKGNNKPPQIPSLKAKIHQASLGLASESAGASTAVNNLSNTKTHMSMSVAPMTAGTVFGKGQQILTGGGELRMTGKRGSLTHLSQLTPSQQPLTGEDRLPLHFMNSQNFKRTQARAVMAPSDAQSLFNYKLLEDQNLKVMKSVPDLQSPYLKLARPSEQEVHTQEYDKLKKRKPFSYVEEVDCAVSEPNRIKKIIYRHNLGFQDWFNTLNLKSQEISHRKRTQTKKFLN